MSRLVKCTIIKDLSKDLKRGRVVEYDPFKADAWEKAGFLVKGEKSFPAVEKGVEKYEEKYEEIADKVFKGRDPEAKPKRQRKAKEQH